MVKYLLTRKWLFATFILFAAGYTGTISAHEGSATLGFDRHFTGVALINCSNNDGESDNLVARIRDNSPSVPGLLVNLQIFKGNKSISVTDNVSGDAEWSPFITLQAGSGGYWVFVNKTDEGERHFDLEYHCHARDAAHTETGIFVHQFGLPEFISE